MHIKWKVKLLSKRRKTLQENTASHPLRSSGWHCSINQFKSSFIELTFIVVPHRAAPRRVSATFFRRKSSLSPISSRRQASPITPIRVSVPRSAKTAHEGFLDPRRVPTRCGATRRDAWEGIEARAKGVFPPYNRSRSMGSPWRQTSPYLYSPRYFPVKLPELPASCRPCTACRSQGSQDLEPAFVPP